MTYEITWDAFCAAGEDLRGEFVEGRYVPPPQRTLEHQVATTGLVSLFRGSVFSVVQQWAWRPSGLPIEYVPDIVVLGHEPDGDAHWTEVEPVLVIEVTSPDAVVKDWVRNMRHYARFGARHYWILDHRDHALYTFALQEGQFEETAQSAGRLIVPGWEQLGEVDVEALWR